MGVVTMASVAIHMQTSASLMHDLSSASPVWIDQYAERFENAYESFHHQLQSQNSSSEGMSAEEDKATVDKLAEAGEVSITDALAASEASAAAAFEAAAAIGDDEPSTPAPTSTVIVVAPPLDHKAPESPPSDPTALASEQDPELAPLPRMTPNVLPPWVLQQVPCAGTGSQYCARGLEPASPPPILQNADELEPIPAAWLQEVQ